MEGVVEGASHGFSRCARSSHDAPPSQLSLISPFQLRNRNRRLYSPSQWRRVLTSSGKPAQLNASVAQAKTRSGYPSFRPCLFPCLKNSAAALPVSVFMELGANLAPRASFLGAVLRPWFTPSEIVQPRGALRTSFHAVNQKQRLSTNRGTFSFLAEYTIL